MWEHNNIHLTTKSNHRMIKPPRSRESKVLLVPLMPPQRLGQSGEFSPAAKRKTRVTRDTPQRGGPSIKMKLPQRKTEHTMEPGDMLLYYCKGHTVYFHPTCFLIHIY